MMGVTHRRQKNAAVMMVTCLLRAGPARRKEGRKSSTKEELMLPRAIASSGGSVVSSLCLTNDTIMQSSIGGCEASRCAVVRSAPWSSVSCHNSPTLLYIKHGALYPVERSLDYQFPFC